MMHTFKFVKRETVDYEIEIDAENLELAIAAFGNEIEDGYYAAGGGDIVDSETLVRCEECGEPLHPTDAYNCRINIGSETERIVCYRCAQGMLNREALVECQICFGLYEETALCIDPATGKRTICPECHRDYREEV